MSVKPLLDAYRDYLSLRSEETVRNWFDGFAWNMSERDVGPRTLRASRHLDGILDHVGSAERRLVTSLLEHAPRLQWLQSYTADDFGEHFVDNYGHVELIGTRGHFVSDKIAGGLVLFGPGLEYPNHWHVAEELYFPLTSGAHWSRDNGEFEPRESGAFIHHEFNMPHAMKMFDAPLLAAWVWRGGDLAQKSDY